MIGRLGRKTADAAKTLVYGSRFYATLLKGRHPHGFEHTPADPWPGDAAAADALFQGRYRFHGWEAAAPGEAPWLRDDMPDEWHEALHGFAWIRHFTARGGDAAQRHVRAMANDWAETFPDWHPVAWRADIIGRRMMSWVSHGQYLIHHAELTYRSRILDSLARQARHLNRAAAGAPPGLPRLTAAIGLVFAGLGLPDGRRRLAHGLNRLESELAGQILADGGHVSRNPSIHMAVLRDLIATRAALAGAGHEVPVPLQNAIDRMAPMLRFFRLGDGALAVFHGGHTETEGAVDLTLSRSGAAGKPLDSAPHAGFERLVRGRTVVVMDTGAAEPAADGACDDGAGALAFAFAVGRQRIVGNAGICRAPDETGTVPVVSDPDSTVVLDGTAPLPADTVRRYRADRPIVTCTRNESDDGIWLDADHDGYAARYGLRHHRRLYLAAAGDDLRGEDSLTATGGRKPRDVPFTLVFHLHPGVQVAPVQDGGALLRLADGSGWRVRVGGGTLAVETGFYCGGETPERTSRLVLTGRTGDGDVTVKWAFRRVEQPDEAAAAEEGTLL